MYANAKYLFDVDVFLYWYTMKHNAICAFDKPDYNNMLIVYLDALITKRSDISKPLNDSFIPVIDSDYTMIMHAMLKIRQIKLYKMLNLII